MTSTTPAPSAPSSKSGAPKRRKKSPSPNIAAPRTDQTGAAKGDELTRIYSPAGMYWLTGGTPVSYEDEATTYSRIEQGFADLIRPTNIMEWIWVRELTDATWEEQLLLNARKTLIALKEHEAAEEVYRCHRGTHMGRSFSDPNTRELAEEWMQQEGRAVTKMAKAFDRLALNDTSLADVAYIQQFKTLQAISIAVDKIRSRRTRLISTITKLREDLAPLLAAPASQPQARS